MSEFDEAAELEQPDPVVADEIRLHRALGPVSLIMIGIGSIIGAGIFVYAGTAAATHAGPAVLISFAIAGTGCLFAGLCYAEFASMIPESGSSYTYAYATMGRFMAWFIGWNMVLEYGVSASGVAAGWSGYFVSFLQQVGIAFPASFANAPIEGHGVSDLKPFVIHIAPAVDQVHRTPVFQLIVGGKYLRTPRDLPRPFTVRLHPIARPDAGQLHGTVPERASTTTRGFRICPRPAEDVSLRAEAHAGVIQK